MEGIPLVSVFCPTYNHEKYIRQCLEGFVMQKTNFPIEIIVQDDASTDNTSNIVNEFAEKYNFIIPVIHVENIYSQGKNLNEYFYKNAKGKYIALCEGDDYWTDPYKLQKQVDFLEANEEFSFCFHNAVTYFVDRDVSKDFNHKLKSQSYNTNDFLMKGWFIPTASLLIRKSMLPNPFPEWFFNVCSGDYALELLLSIKGDSFYINEKMSVYRKNAINSLSIKGLKGMDSLKKRLFLLKEFKNSNANKNTFANNYAITKVRYNQLKVLIYKRFPFVVTLKDIILHRK